ncbi:helix-turn-helix domain-containing protein [Leptolyngbya sp. AN03gr2]|uniref:helix-turn-helix domain-containing protein n=1 Tax=unclassified Leptolyngbya TaxID=2650499 RepID=UPI003D31CFDB
MPQASSKHSKQRGRYSVFPRPATSPDLFADGSTDRLASNRLIWESCNILTQGESLGWLQDEQGLPHYKSVVSKGKGYISFWLTDDLHTDHPAILESEAALALIEQFDIRAACMHLIYAAHATQLERPWEQSFTLSDTQLERYLGLDRNKKLTKQQKLEQMLEWAKQPCRLLVYISYPSQGKVPMFSVSRTWLWEIAEPILHFQNCLTDDHGNSVGSETLVGFTLKVRCGHWAEYFLNEERRRNQSGYYECGILSQQILQDLMGTWHHQEGAARLMAWLLFKTKVNCASPVTVETLMKVAFGAEALQAARSDPRKRTALIRKWMSAVRSLLSKSWQITPDAKTYPRHYWVEPSESQLLAQIPDEPEAAIAFWTEEADSQQLIDVQKRFRGGFERLLGGRLWIQPPAIIAEKLSSIAPSSQSSPEPRSSIAPAPKPVKPIIESGEQMKQFRLSRGWSQADLAAQLERSVSWVKMVENGKRRLQSIDQSKFLKLSQSD